MAERAGSSTFTETVTVDETDSAGAEEFEILNLRVSKEKNEKHVKWTEGTVDNEHLNRKKSKCCCIYKKPREFGESSSDSDDECENCFGHVERKHKPGGPGGAPADTDHPEATPAPSTAH